MATRHDFEDAYSTCTSDEENQEAEDVQESKDCKEFIPTTCPPRGRAFLDPRSEWVQEWNRVFLLVCATGLFIDPLFFYTLSISESCMCVFVDGWFAVTVTVLRCVTDALHVWNMWLQFKMSRWWRSPHHHRGLSHDDDVARNVAARIITKAKKSFVFDLFVILPIPQSLVYFILCIKTETRSCGRGFMALQHGAQPHSPINTTIQARASIATATGTVISIVLKA